MERENYFTFQDKTNEKLLRKRAPPPNKTTNKHNTLRQRTPAKLLPFMFYGI